MNLTLMVCTYWENQIGPINFHCFSKILSLKNEKKTDRKKKLGLSDNIQKKGEKLKTHFFDRRL